MHYFKGLKIFQEEEVRGMRAEKGIYYLSVAVLAAGLFILGGCSLKGGGASGQQGTETAAAGGEKEAQDVLLKKGATLLPGENVKIALRRQKIVHAESKDSCVEVTAEGEVTAVEPGRSVVQVTDENGYKYQFPVWVREKNDTLGREIRTVIIGNSLMGKGHFQDGLEIAAEAYGQKLKVHDFSRDNYALKTHLSQMEKGKRPKLVKEVKKADVLIIQGMSRDRPASVVKKLRRYCKPGAKIYFYETEFMQPSPTKDFDVILAEDMLQSTYALNYYYEDFHVPNDYHPNGFYCQLASLMAYAQIFHETCREYPEALIDSRLYSSLRGGTQEKQTENFYQICDVIDQKLEEYSAKAAGGSE